MSSSKVFKQDPHFTPTPLVRRDIAPARKEGKTAVVEKPSAPAATAANAPPPDVPPPQPEPAPAPVIDVEAIRQEAYNQGMADLAAQWQRELEQTLAAFADGCQKIDSHRKTMFSQSREDLINLIILLSEKILGRELTTPRNIIAATLQSALEQAIESEEYYVTLHPEDLAFAEAKAPELITAIRGLSRLVFKTDDTLTRGGCLLESTLCTVDASIETQLAGMKEFLTEQPLFVPVADIDPPVPSGQAAEEPPATET